MPFWVAFASVVAALERIEDIAHATTFLEQCAQLDAMGFERSKVEAAVIASNYDLRQATNRLLGQG